MPIDLSEASFKTCCGKSICNGCIYALSSEGVYLCPFCRMPEVVTDEEHVKRVKKLTDKGNANAFNCLASCYDDGTGTIQDSQKANELYLKAGELGSSEAYYNLGCSYRRGTGVESDMKKAKYYWEFAAMSGHIKGRYNLGMMEGKAGNYVRAMKHYLISARAGDKKSLEAIRAGFTDGIITKDEYANTLRSYQKSQNEMKSDARDKAAAYYGYA